MPHSLAASIEKIRLMRAAEETPGSKAPKKEPKGTSLVGYLPIAKTCNNCRYITNDLTQCANKKVAKDKGITDGPNGLKNIVPTGWCNEWESK